MVLSRLLFWLACGIATSLLLLIIVSPWLVKGETEGVTGCTRWLHLFAHDATLRRTTLASGLGLLVTACVFFRQQSSSVSPRRSPKADR